MRSFIFHIAFLLIGMLSVSAFAQDYAIRGMVVDSSNSGPIGTAEILLEPNMVFTRSDEKGLFVFEGLSSGNYRVIVMAEGFERKSEEVIVSNGDVKVKFMVAPKVYDLGTVTIADEQLDFSWDYLRNVEGTSIYAGKKNEVIYIDKLIANLATNNPRQVYSHVAGINIWESDGAGLQLGIGGRGLSPNRTSNFNTRQNGYDISADALGYPESYYTPPTEAVERIEIVRGAASLQYGTQFGGMLNFKMKEGPADKKFELTSRQTLGSWWLFNSFNSAGGTVANGKVNYYGYYQFKRGNGWRPNSQFNVHSAYGSVKYKVTPRLKLGADYTFMNYIAKQAGGLTDAMFAQDNRQSIRDRNWFKINWNLFALTADYDINERTRINIRNFGLVAERSSLGFLGPINRPDPMDERNLINGQFRNFGTEVRFLHGYDLFKNPSTLLVGMRYYQGHAQGRQGLAPDGDEADFEFLNPDNLENSDYIFPSRNVSVFVENIFSITPKLTITPGFRFEYIQTASEGYYREIYEDLAGNVIYDERVDESRLSKRSLPLFGLGLSYKESKGIEVYGNISQNYRAINFNDQRIVNPNTQVDVNLQDEKGFNADLGMRGRIPGILTYDLSAFFLLYHNRIGNYQPTSEDVGFDPTKLYRMNIGDSRNIGVEALVELDVLHLIKGKDFPASLSLFTNAAYIDARYFNMRVSAFRDRKVELVPNVNLKSGLNFRWKDLEASYMVCYTGKQFTDATNSEFVANAVYGEIPAYYVMDISVAYSWKWFKLSSGMNNMTNNQYFTRRATAYPGPGIIPAEGRSFYVTLQVKL